MAGLGSSHRCLGPELAHHEDGRDRVSTPHLSQFVYVVRASAARVGVVFSEGFVSHSAYVLARTVHPVIFQYARVARLGPVSLVRAMLATGGRLVFGRKVGK